MLMDIIQLLSFFLWFGISFIFGMASLSFTNKMRNGLVAILNMMAAFAVWAVGSYYYWKIAAELLS